MDSHRVVFQESKEKEAIRLLPGEKILCLQRQHFVAFLFPMLVPIIIAGVFLLLLFLYQETVDVFPISATMQLAVIFSMFSFLLVFETFAFMRWYFQFYIITTKCLLHIHFFRIGGYHFDEVFLEKTPIREIDRSAPNALYDLFDIDNVYVHFQRLERPEPFIFVTPENPQIIEDLLEEGVLGK